MAESKQLEQSKRLEKSQQFESLLTNSPFLNETSLKANPGGPEDKNARSAFLKFGIAREPETIQVGAQMTFANVSHINTLHRCTYTPKNGPQLKIIRKRADLRKRASLKHSENPLNEVELLWQLQQGDMKAAAHPNLVRLLGYDLSEDHIVTSYFEEYNQGDLLTAVQKTLEPSSTRHGFSENKTRLLFRQMCEAVQFLHVTHNIAHLDISPENFFLGALAPKPPDSATALSLEPAVPLPGASEQKDASKISGAADLKDGPPGPSGGTGALALGVWGDFGVARYISKEYKIVDDVGKAYYRAPEVAAKVPFEGKPADMWSLGVCLFVMLTGKPLWARASHEEAAYRLVAVYRRLDELLLLWCIEDRVSPKARVLLNHLLVEDPAKRWTIEQVLSSSFLKV